MRELILNEIEILRDTDYNKSRWTRWYIQVNDKLNYFGTKKERRGISPTPIELIKATRADIDTLDDNQLLACYTSMVRIASKQM